MKDKKQKELILEQLRKTPIAQYACEKSGVARSTYYRWKKDSKFSKLADEAIMEGVLMINDLAEAQLISAIKDRNMTSLIFWLKNRHSAYAEKILISGKVEAKKELSPAQKKLIRKALKLSALDNNKFKKII
jgi:hypothetical protein